MYDVSPPPLPPSAQRERGGACAPVAPAAWGHRSQGLRRLSEGIRGFDDSNLGVTLNMVLRRTMVLFVNDW